MLDKIIEIIMTVLPFLERPIYFSDAAIGEGVEGLF